MEEICPRNGKDAKLLFVIPYVLVLIKLILGNTTFCAYVDVNGIMSPAIFLTAVCCIAIKVLFVDRFTGVSFVWAGIIFGMAIMNYFAMTYTDMLFLAVLLIGTKNIKMDLVVWCHFVVYLTITLIAMVCAFAGWIDHHVVYEASRGYRYALGNTYPTDFAAGIFYLFLDFIFLKRNCWKHQYSIGILVISAVVYFLTNARMFMILSAVLVMTMFWFNNLTVQRFLASPVASKLCAAMFPLCAGLSLYAQWIYRPDMVFLEKLNHILNNRISLGHRGLTEYGLSIWGQKIEMIGGGYGTKAGTYFFVDNGYLHLALLYGGVILFFVCAGFAYVCLCTHRHSARTRAAICIIMMMIAISSFIEPRFFSLTYSAYILCIGIELFSSKKRDETCTTI